MTKIDVAKEVLNGILVGDLIRMGRHCSSQPQHAVMCHSCMTVRSEAAEVQSQAALGLSNHEGRAAPKS